MSAIVKRGEHAARNMDERFGSANFFKRNLPKVFPDHWSFMLGEIALYSFMIVLISGVFLTFFFKPSMVEIVYDGSYAPLKGVEMSQAYASTLDISFDIRGGLLMRQIHHWAALFFVAAISVHLLRVFFTGAFRKPREINWIIGVGLLTLALVAGFAGYSLPDDLLSGTGLRIAQGIMLSIPLIGTYLSFLVFGGQFPGSEFISRLYAIHILLVPGIILALVTAHLIIVWYQKHTQFPGAGRTNENVVGYRFMPIYMAKAGGFFFAVFGITTLIAGLVTINPIWAYGPYTPDQVTAGSQPDWYIGWLEGALRMMPNWESNFFGWTISWNIFVPSAVVPGLIFTAMALYPFFEAWITGDTKEHHLLDRPRNNPTRTAIGAMSLTFYILLWFGGGNDLVARFFDLSINSITWFLRVAIFVVPPIVFVITKRTCLSLQRRDRDKLLHGWETGQVLRLPHGEFIEIHGELSTEERGVLLSKPDVEPLALPPTEDANGVKKPGSRKDRLRARLSKWFYGDNIPLPTPEELAAADAHLAHEIEQTQPILDEDAQAKVGHAGVITEEGVVHHDAALTSKARAAAATIEAERTETGEREE